MRFFIISTLIFIYFSISYAEHDPLYRALEVSTNGIEIQNQRVKVIAENVSNKDVTGHKPGSDPYVRKVIFLRKKVVKDKFNNNKKLFVKSVYKNDNKTPFQNVYNPNHPAANDKGIVKLSNVNPLIEAADAEDAKRSYEANLAVHRTVNSMISNLISELGK